ncbi:MAG: hypothetical protein ACP5QX_05690 [Caldisericaceae bacterium]
MQSRNFIVSLNLHKPVSNDISGIAKETFVSLGYKLLAQNDEKLVFEKGSKIFTYVGLVNWSLLYRKVDVEISSGKGEVVLTYCFSWLTNIGVLIKSAMPEIKVIQGKLAADSLKVERFR